MSNFVLFSCHCEWDVCYVTCDHIANRMTKKIVAVDNL